MQRKDGFAPLSGSHLSDDQLMETYVMAVEDSHLSSCRQCRTRFDEVVRSLQHMHDAAVRDADAAFTGERLHDQRDRIMQRIERHDHPAEVLAFPYRTTSHPAVHRLLGPARRWVAGAAAAGLAAGMFLGFFMDRRMHDTEARPVQAAPVQASTWQTDARDDLFFLEVEEALVGSRVREMRPELGAIDLMTTPLEIREVSYVRD
jgi:hypothetical protein